MYIVQNDYHNKFSYYPSPHSYNFFEDIFLGIFIFDATENSVLKNIS